jgi:hypothetical protein
MGTFTTLTSASGATLQLVDAAISTLYRLENSDIELRHGATAAGGYWVFYNPATSNRTLTCSTVTDPISITISSGTAGSLTLIPNKSVTLRYVSGSNYITL